MSTTPACEQRVLVLAEIAATAEYRGAARDQWVAAVDYHAMAIRVGLGLLARSRAGSHPFEWAMRFGGKAHHDAIPRRDPAACYHDAHDPSLAHHFAVAIASKNGV